MDPVSCPLFDLTSVNPKGCFMQCSSPPPEFCNKLPDIVCSKIADCPDTQFKECQFGLFANTRYFPYRQRSKEVLGSCRFNNRQPGRFFEI